MLGFVSPVPVAHPRVKKSVCQRRPPLVASAGEQSDGSWQNTPNYNALGTGIQSKGIQTIEFYIYPNGIVEEKVSGIRGKECCKLTKRIEEALGTVTNVQHTGEFYENVEEVAEKNIEAEGTDKPRSWSGSQEYPTW